MKQILKRTHKDSGVDQFIRDCQLGLQISDFTILKDEGLEVLSVDGTSLGLVRVGKINNLNRINKYFESINNALKKGQFFLLSLETQEMRKLKILSNYPSPINYVVYLFDFIFNRILPKLSFSQSLYFKTPLSKNRAISLTECLGRLISSGFDIINTRKIGYSTYIMAQKKSFPEYDLNPTYGPLIKLKRVGLGGQFFEVYKFRTMYPYSEYLQEYIFERNNLQSGGKIKDDFRVTSWGKWFRKFWIDELPMILNLFKGQMKLVGVRPLSYHYFKLYPEKIQELRSRVKPGLIPPFYADLPKTLDEIVESETKYIDSYLKNPLATDVSYLVKATYNIMIKRVRSN